MSGGLPVTTQLKVENTQVAQRADFPGAVAGLAGQGQALLQVCGSPRVVALAQVEDTEADECFRLGGGVAHVARGEAGLAVDSDRLGVVAAIVKVAEQGGGQAGGMAGPAVGGGVCTATATRVARSASSQASATAESVTGGAGVAGGGMRGRRSPGNSVSIATAAVCR